MLTPCVVTLNIAKSCDFRGVNGPLFQPHIYHKRQKFNFGQFLTIFWYTRGQVELIWIIMRLPW